MRAKGVVILSTLAAFSLLLAGCFQPARNDLSPTSVDLAALTAMAPTATPSPTVFVEPTATPTQVPPTPSPTETPAVAAPDASAASVEPAIESTPFDMFATQDPNTAPQATTEIAPSMAPATDSVIIATIPPDMPPTLSTDAAAVLPGAEPTGDPAFALPPTPTALPTPDPCLHVVQPGEWMLKIARDLGIDGQALIDANPAFANRTLQPGDVLIIPNCTPDATPPPPTAVPTNQPTIDPAAPTPINLETCVTAGMNLRRTACVYSVVEFDTLGAIARKLNVTVNDIVRENNLNPTDFLHIGQQLRIPAPIPAQ